MNKMIIFFFLVKHKRIKSLQIDNIISINESSFNKEMKESYSISLGEYYYKIGNKKMLSKMNNKKSNDSNIREIEKLWSLNSLKKQHLKSI